MGSIILRFWGTVGALSVIGALLVVPFAPTHALSSKTYSFTPTHAKNYVTTGSVDFSGTSAATSWYSPDWKYRQKITINQEFVGEELTDFPVLVRLDDQALSGAHEDRRDLIVTSADGVTKLAHELEDAITVWVKVPALSPDQDTVLYLYYGNPDAEDQQNAKQVWTNGYLGLWHLNQQPQDGFVDSSEVSGTGRATSNVENGNSAITGKIGNGVTVAGGRDFITVGDGGNLDATFTAFTASAWVKRNSAGNSRYIMGKMGLPGNRGWQMYFWTDDQFYVDFFNAPAGSSGNMGTTEKYLPSAEWLQVSFTFAANTKQAIYVNGEERASSTQTLSQLNGANSRPFRIGDRGDAEDFGYSAVDNTSIDEVRVSNVVRSSAWVKAEYQNQCACEDFLTISDTVESSLTTPVSSTSPSTGTATITLKADRPLSFSSLQSFTVNAGGEALTFQLSNDAGKTWLFYTKDGWKGANPKEVRHRSSALDLNNHLKAFPRGEGRLLWKAYLSSTTTLDQIIVTYAPGTATGGGVATMTPVTSLSDPRILAINTLFATVFNRQPTYDEWLYWANRLINGEKTTEEELLGAMQWAAGR